MDFGNNNINRQTKDDTSAIRSLVCFPVILMLVLCWQRGVAAQTDGTDPLPEHDVSLRFSLFSGIPDVVGISASITSLHPFDVELGGSLGISASGVGPSAYLRTGAATVGAWTCLLTADIESATPGRCVSLAVMVLKLTPWIML